MKRFLVVAWALTLVSAAQVLSAAPAPRPSTFFGTVTVAGSPVPPGTPVSAWLGGEAFAETGTFEVDGQSVHRLDVPGDVLDTAPVEGGVEGQEVVFQIGNALTMEKGTWSDGAVSRVDLSAEAGPDLATWPAFDLADGASTTRTLTWSGVVRVNSFRAKSFRTRPLMIHVGTIERRTGRKRGPDRIE